MWSALELWKWVALSVTFTLRFLQFEHATYALRRFINRLEDVADVDEFDMELVGEDG